MTGDSSRADMRTGSGRCLCGAVKFRATNVPATISICHCEMCRRWTGSAFLCVTLPEGAVTWEDEAAIARLQSTSWAERGWCSACGSGLYFRVTDGGPYSGEIELPLGIFDEPNGFTISHEIYIDHKPDSYTYAGEGRKQLTRAECVAKFSALDGV